MKLIKAMMTVAGFTLISRVLGFIRDVMTAIVMGAGPLADAFFVALKLPNLFRRISAEGAFSVAFIPLFSESIERDGEAESKRMARNMMGFMCAILFIFSLIAMFAMPYVIRAIAPGFEVGEERFTNAVELSRVTFPYLFFISLAALLGGVMNTIGRFGIYAFLPSLFNLCLIGVLLTHDAIWDSPAQALAYGVLAAGIVQFICIFFYAAKHGWLIYPTMPQVTPKVKKMGFLMLPGIIGAGVYHLNIFADMIIASFLESGSISYLYYADRLQQLPLGVVGIAVGTALLPLLSRSLVNKNYKEANQFFNRAIEACLLFALPAAIALMIASKPIVLSLFQYGAFDLKDARMTAVVLQCYALGLPFYIVAKIFQSACFANQDTKTPVKIAIVGALTNIALGLSLAPYIGVAGIALATAISGILQIGLLYTVMRKTPYLSFDRRLKVNSLKIIISSLIMGVVIYVFYKSFRITFWDDSPNRIIAIIGLVGCGSLTYLLSIFSLKVMKRSDLKLFFSKEQKQL